MDDNNNIIKQHGKRQDQEDCLDEGPHVFSYYTPLPLLAPDSLTILLKPPHLLLSVSHCLSSDGYMAVTTHTHTHTIIFVFLAFFLSPRFLLYLFSHPLNSICSCCCYLA